MKDRRGLGNFCDNSSSVDLHTRGNSHVHIPELFCIQRVYLHTSGYILAGLSGDHREGSLNTVKNIVQDSRSKGNRNRVPTSGDRLSGLQAAGLFKDLDGSGVLSQRDNLPHQMLFSYMNHFGHLEPCISFQIDDRAVDAVNNTSSTHASALRQN